jgi:CheY-like chemotaxis protein
MHSHSLARTMDGSTQALRLHRSERMGWHPGRPSTAPPEVGFAPADLRILIVNEDMQSANALKWTLNDLGYCTTLTAYSASRALIAADDFSPALAFLDLDLPDMSGFQLAQKLRAHSRRHVRQVPLIAVAEQYGFGTLELVRAAGFMGCLRKPVLAAAIHELLRQVSH